MKKQNRSFVKVDGKWIVVEGKVPNSSLKPRTQVVCGYHALTCHETAEYRQHLNVR
jgi:hypothetical protein